MTKVPGNVEGTPFRAAAGRVRRRLLFCRWLSALGACAVLVFVPGLGLLAAARLLGAPQYAGWETAALLIAAWASGSFLWAAARRPGAFAALALWDERAGRKEAFASACFFEGKPRLEAGERLHLSASLERLEREASSLRRDLPLPRPGARWALPLLLAAFAMSPIFEPALEAGDIPLTQEMQEAAKAEAQRLAGAKIEFEKTDSLSDQEKEEIEKLRQEIEAAAGELQQSQGKSVREVLRELEKRARAAEELAERMGGGGEEWASEELLREMSQHADTADLAAPLKDREAAASAGEADRIAERLEARDLSNEAKERMDAALARIVEAARPEDHKRPVGRDIGAAAQDMAAEKPAMAAKDFERLADHFRRLEERERAQEKLRELAEELRKSGSNVAGKNLESMKQLAGSEGTSMKSMQALTSPGGQSLTPMNGQNLPNLGQGQPMPAPGLQPGKAGQGQPMTFAPVPGGAKGKPVAIVPGAAQGQKPSGMVMAPIPGTSGAPAAMMPGGGGLQAGAGSAPMEKSPTSAMAAEESGLVGAQVNEDGEAAYRAVEGGERSEGAQRGREEQIVEFIRVEEEALDEQALPMSRKEHVLRYFTALRERYEGR